MKLTIKVWLLVVIILGVVIIGWFSKQAHAKMLANKNNDETETEVETTT